jgi:hypothetical protein
MISKRKNKIQQKLFCRKLAGMVARAVVAKSPKGEPGRDLEGLSPNGGATRFESLLAQSFDGERGKRRNLLPELVFVKGEIEHERHFKIH